MDEALNDEAENEAQALAKHAASDLLALPWELLHDGQGYLLQGDVRVRRRLPNRVVKTLLSTEPPLRVLLVSPRPEDECTAYIDHRVSVRPVVEALNDLGTLAEFRVLEPPTFAALSDALSSAARAGRPYHVVHFDGSRRLRPYPRSRRTGGPRCASF